MQMRVLSRWHSLVAIPYLVGFLAFVACAGSKLLHFDGRPFILSAPITWYESGWMAVDSCEQGIHIIVELEVEARQRGLFSVNNDVALAYSSGHVQRPRHLRVEGPFYRPTGLPQGWEDAGYLYGREMRGMVFPPDERSTQVYVVRAEFVLDRLPPANDFVFVVHGGQMTPVRWERTNRKCAPLTLIQDMF